MSIEALKEQARNHEQSEDWVKALEAYEEAIRRQGDEDQPDLGLYNRAGDLSTRLQDPLGAIRHYERAVELYLESELPNNAIAILKKILRNMPDRAEVYLRMGQIRAGQGFFTDARDNFLIYAENMENSGNMEEAFRALSEFADLAPEDVEIRLTLAEQFHAHDNPPEALEHFIRAHQTLSARGDESGVASVEERIYAIDADAVIPAPSPAGADSYAGGGQSTPVFADDEPDEGEIAFDGALEHGDAAAAAVVEAAVDMSDAGAASDDGLWAEAAVPTEASAEIEIEIDDELDELVLDDEVISESTIESVSGAAEISEGGLEDAYIDFDAVAEAEDEDQVSSSSEEIGHGPKGESDAWQTASPAETGWDSESDEAEGAALEPDAISDWAAAEEDEPSWETTSEFSVEPEAVVGEDGSSDAEETGEVEDVSEVEGMSDDATSDDFAPEDIGGELPLLSFDDDGAEAEAAAHLEDTAVAVETDEDDALPEFESAAEGEDEWIGLDEGESAEAGTTEAESWSAGTEFELETVQFGTLGEDELREYVDANPQSGQAWEHMGRLVVARGDQGAAAESFEAAHAAYAEDRDFHSAMRAVRELLLIDPDSAAYHQRLVEYAHRGDDRTLLVSAFLELGDCLLRTGAPEKSDAVYQKVLDIDPGNFRAQSALGLADQAEAAEVADTGYVDLGSMVLEKREKTTRWTVETEEPTTEDDFDFSDMLKQFRAKVAEHVDHDDVQAHYDLGTAYKEMGLLDEAISEFQQALRADGRNLATFEVLGQSFMEKGQPEVAIRTLKRATEMPFDVEDELLGIYYYLGRAYEELGNRDEAVEYYEKIFALDINFEDVTERLRSLR